MDQMKNKKMLKPWHGLILLALSIGCIFFLSPWLSYQFNLGLYGTLLNELFLLILAVLTVLIFGGDFKKVFPFKRIKMTSVFGVLFTWMGWMGLIMILSMYMTALFPRQMMETGGGLGNYFTSVSLIVSMLIVSLSPAICEEAVFRGVVLNSFRGSMGKWAAIISSGVIFGAMHGSVWRFMQTAILGIVMAYIVCETGNIFYSILLHAINNAFPILLLFFVEKLYSLAGMYSVASEGAVEVGMPISLVGCYWFFGGAIAFLIYIGHHLLHVGMPGYQKGLFPREKRKILYILLTITFVCILISIISFCIFLLMGSAPMQNMMESIYERL